MVSTKVIRKVFGYELIHYIFQDLFRVTDGTELSNYFETDTKESLMNMREDIFCDEARVLIELSNI